MKKRDFIIAIIFVAISCMSIGFAFGFMVNRPFNDFDVIAINTDGLIEEYDITGYKFVENGIIVYLSDDDPVFVSNGMYVLDNSERRSERILSYNEIDWPETERETQ